jgi:hypothetical protein
MKFVQKRKEVYGGEKTRDKVSLAILYSQHWETSGHKFIGKNEGTGGKLLAASFFWCCRIMESWAGGGYEYVGGA